MSAAGRYTPATPARVADDWTLQALTPASRLYGANGLRTGPDGRLYVAQVSGSQISAVDVTTGVVEAISPMGSDIVAPDDLVFDDKGNLYATEITEGRVSVRAPNGSSRVLWGDMPCANPIAFHNGRLFAGECRVGGRIVELDLNGGAPRVLLDNVPMPNAMEVGPDGLLYIPIMGTNEIWRIPLEGGAPQVVATDLGVPDAVKFDAAGYIVSTQVASGQVLRIDPRTGERTVLADIAPGLDNLSFVGERLFVSSISGQITEILAPGEVRSLLPDGFNWPLGLAVDEDGVLYIADGPYTYTLREGGTPQVASMLFAPGSPGYIRGIAAAGRGEIIVTTANGIVARYQPASQAHEVLASGFDQLYGVALVSPDTVLFVELGGGRVLSASAGKVETLASGLRQPMGVAIDADGACLVSESGAGRVVRVGRGGVDTVLDGLQQPQGLYVQANRVYIVDAGAKELLEYDLRSGNRRCIASGLPVGPPPGVVPKFLGAIGDMSGPMGPFAGITGTPDGTLYLSGDADGSILALRPSAAANG